MALIGKKLAIASVGISCQPAHQIYTHAGLIAELAGEDLRTHVTPFDWLLVGAADVARMIGDGTYYPHDFEVPRIDPKPFWPRYNAHFWHAKTSNPADFLSKHGHMTANWAQIRDAARSIFIVANTQNNVRRALLEAGREPIDETLDEKTIVALYSALRGQFGPAAELHVVTRDDVPSAFQCLSSDYVFGRPAISLHRIGADGSQWAGDSRAWQSLFKRII